MYLRSHSRSKDGKSHAYWSLVETVRTPDGPRQKAICYLGELNSSAQARWQKTVEVFNKQGDAEQLKLFPSHVVAPDGDPDVARVLLNKVRWRGHACSAPAFLDWNYGSVLNWITSLKNTSIVSRRMCPGRA